MQGRRACCASTSCRPRIPSSRSRIIPSPPPRRSRPRHRHYPNPSRRRPRPRCRLKPRCSSAHGRRGGPGCRRASPSPPRRRPQMLPHPLTRRMR